MNPSENKNPRGKEYWRSLEDLAQTPDYLESAHREFPEGASEIEPSGIDRRGFLGLMGASAALAGTTMTGCLLRKPKETILPFSSRPEDLIPGKPQFYATSALIGPSVVGLVIENHEGRPTKVEGNPKHPMSQGAANAWAQASVLELYDPDRSTKPLHKGKEADAKAVDGFLGAHFGQLREKGGEGLALLIGHRPSPTFNRLLANFKAAYPKASLFLDDPAAPSAAREALASLGAKGVTQRVNYDKARVILSVDCDFLGIEADAVASTKAFAKGRRGVDGGGEMNRLYAVETLYSTTGAAADNRLRLPASQIHAFLKEVGAALVEAGLGMPSGAETFGPTLKGMAKPVNTKWAKAVAADLMKNKGASAITVGCGQPVRVHALAAVLNEALGNNGPVIEYRPDDTPEAETLAGLARELKAGKFDTLVMLGGNPAYTAPADLDFGSAIGKARTSVHCGLHVNETAEKCEWHIPVSHYLESWGDWRASDGTASIQQPLIAPLYDTLSEWELLARINGDAEPNGYELVKGNWNGTMGAPLDFEIQWRRALHDGVIASAGQFTAAPVWNWSTLAEASLGGLQLPEPKPDSLEIVFALDSKVYDGRWSNNGWLQELPDVMSKLTWDNAALVSPKTAAGLGIERRPKGGAEQAYPMVEIEHRGQKINIVAWVTPGLPENVVVLPLGYGKTAAGRIQTGAGVNAGILRRHEAPLFDQGAKMRQTGATYPVASTQDHWLLGPDQEAKPDNPLAAALGLKPFKDFKERNHYREATLEEHRHDPHWVHEQDTHGPEIKSLWTEPNERSGQQWGLTIDLNTCTGCNACAIACQSENNIPVIGKEPVMRGREMHWIRLDRYFRGGIEEPEAVFQPMACQQCENAPCEQVCPVAATTHSPEGLNDMAYNRCIGTRYCLNNCPYKVRRFNFFNYNLSEPQNTINPTKATFTTKPHWHDQDRLEPLDRMQKNPDVTIRMRGVMEKCTYCVQRIQEAKIEAKVHGDGVVPDGAVTPACAQTCPAEAIVFGDVSDPKSRVSEIKRRNRNYDVLAELNTKPRTSYLAKVRNPNPELA